MEISPKLVEQVLSMAAHYTYAAAEFMPEAILALAEEHGNDGTFEVRCAMGVRPCIHFEHRAPDGTVTALFSVQAMTGAEIEKEKNSLH